MSKSTKHNNSSSAAGIGERITSLRKAKGWSQDELAKKLAASRTIIGNYERGINTPSIDALLKMAKLFSVSVDYLTGEGQLSAFDKDTVKRIEDIESLDTEVRQHLFFLIDNVVQNYRTRQAFA